MQENEIKWKGYFKMRLVYSYYSMDILHKGHILLMKNAKALAGEDGKLIVGVLTDKAVMEKKPQPTMGFNERFRLAEAIKYVDLVVPQDTYSPIPNVKRLKPDILMESTSHSDKAIKEAETVLEGWGGKVICLPYYPDISSTAIKKKIKKTGGENEKKDNIS